MRIRLLIRKPRLFAGASRAAAGRPARRSRRMPRNPRAARLSRRITVVALAVAALGTAYVLIGKGGLVSILRWRARAAQLQHDIRLAERHNLELLEQIRALEEDPQAIEKEAREELWMARPGETIYVLPAAPAEEGLRQPQQRPPASPTAPSLPIRR